MKRIIGAIVLSIASCFLMGATTMDDSSDADCVNASQLMLQAEEFDESALGNYQPEVIGTITNQSATESYDDVTVRVDYYDEQNNVIASEMVEVDKDIEPLETEEFDAGLNPPMDVAYANYTVECAEHDRSFVQNLMFWRNI